MAVVEAVPTSARGPSPLAGTLPAGVATGDVVEMLLSCRGGTSAACPTPAGWTAVPGSPFTSGGATTANDVAIFLFRRVYDGVWTMPALSWTGDGTNSGDIFVRSFSGADGVNTEDAAVVATPGAGVGGGSAVLAQLVTVTPGAYVWHALCYGGTATSLVVPDVTDLALVTNPVTGSGHSGAQAAAGGTGTRTYSWTGGAARNFVGIIVAVRPASAPTVQALAAGLQGVGTLAADLKATRGGAAGLQGVATVAADLRATRGLAGTLQGVGIMLADLTVAAAPSGAHGPEDYETAIGPLVSILALRRASLFVTIGDFPPTVLTPPASTMKGSIYIGRGATQPAVAALFRQADTAAKATRLDTWNGSGPTPPSGNFPAGTPATLASDDGSPLFRSNGLPRAKAQNNATQAIPNDTITAVVFANEVADTDGMFDPATSVFTIPFTGQWLVTARINFQQGNAVGYRQAMMQNSSDGSSWVTSNAQARIAAAPGASTDVILAAVMDLNGGRFARVAARHTDGAPLNVGTTSVVAFVYLGPT